jgi:hypothetical protein
MARSGGERFGPGARLKRARMNCRLTCRDVEFLSRVLADRYHDNRYIVRISVLARIENEGGVPNIFHLHSLCVIYSVEMRTILDWYGLPKEPSRKTATRLLSFHLRQ